MSYTYCSNCNDPDCDGFDACTIRALRNQIDALEMTLKEERKHIVRMKDEIGQLMVETAERQREACALQLHGLLTLKNATAVWVGADEIRETPLVTGRGNDKQG